MVRPRLRVASIHHAQAGGELSDRSQLLVAVAAELADQVSNGGGVVQSGTH